MIRPEIVILTNSPDKEALKELLAGIEEEGVLYRVVDEKLDESEKILGYKAANVSQIETGIGLYEKNAALYIQKVPEKPLLITFKAHRILGQNAARYVKGNPLIEI